MEPKLNSHIRMVKKVCSYIPISGINLEVANFDIQKIKKPQIESVQYQRGDLYGYQNLKTYLLCREQAKCQLCSKKSTKGNSFIILYQEKKEEQTIPIIYLCYMKNAMISCIKKSCFIF